MMAPLHLHDKLKAFRVLHGNHVLLRCDFAEIPQHFAVVSVVLRRGSSRGCVAFVGLCSWANHRFQNRNRQISKGANLRPKKSHFRKTEFPSATSRNSRRAGRRSNSFASAPAATRARPNVGSTAIAVCRIAPSMHFVPTFSRGLSEGLFHRASQFASTIIGHPKAEGVSA